MLFGVLGWSLALYSDAEATLSAGAVSAEIKQTQAEECSSLVSVHCGAAPSGAFDEDGRYWVVFVQQEYLYLSYSDNQGVKFSTPIKVNSTPEPIYTDGENRPKLAIGTDHEIYVSWTKRSPERFSGDIRFSRSIDQGKSFSPAQTINDDGLVTSHRFDALLTDHRGDVYLAWLDKRDRQAALAQNSTYTGAALYYAVSTDKGVSFSPNQKVADHSCECCRIAISRPEGSGAAIFWRHIFATNTRDHAFVILGPKAVTQAPQRATVDNWQIDACPHHGPAMTDADNGHYAMAWFTNSPQRKGIYFGSYDAETGIMTHQTSLSHSPGASHPQLLRPHQGLLLAAWKVFNKKKTLILLAASEDNGINWHPPQVVAKTEEASDHPLLVQKGSQAYLSWLTKNEGFRLIPISIQQEG